MRGLADQTNPNDPSEGFSVEEAFVEAALYSLGGGGHIPQEGEQVHQTMSPDEAEHYVDNLLRYSGFEIGGLAYPFVKWLDQLMADPSRYPDWLPIRKRLAEDYSPEEEYVFRLELDRVYKEIKGVETQERRTKANDKWASPGRVALTWPDVDLTARAVLLVMAAHARDDATNIWISQQRIAELLGVSKRTVQRAHDRLEKRKIIKRTAAPRQHKPPTYKINRGPGVT